MLEKCNGFGKVQLNRDRPLITHALNFLHSILLIQKLLQFPQVFVSYQNEF